MCTKEARLKGSSRVRARERARSARCSIPNGVLWREIFMLIIERRVVQCAPNICLPPADSLGKRGPGNSRQIKHAAINSKAARKFHKNKIGTSGSALEINLHLFHCRLVIFQLGDKLTCRFINLFLKNFKQGLFRRIK
jgi:hypothetical protein